MHNIESRLPLVRKDYLMCLIVECVSKLMLLIYCFNIKKCETWLKYVYNKSNICFSNQIAVTQIISTNKFTLYEWAPCTKHFWFLLSSYSSHKVKINFQNPALLSYPISLVKTNFKKKEIPRTGCITNYNHLIKL